MKKGILVAGLLLLLLATAQAVQFTGDFSFEMSCYSPVHSKYTLENDSGTAQTYTIRAVGENSEWIILNGIKIGEAPYVVSLGAGESIVLDAYIKPQDCYVEPGDYTITLKIENGGTLTKEIDVEILESMSLLLSVSPGFESMGQCERSVFEVLVDNAGEYEAVVQLGVDGIASKWVRLASDEFLVEKGASKSISLFVKPECDAQLGKHEFTVSAAMKGTSLVVEQQVELQLEDMQGIEIVAGTLEACSEKEVRREISVMNTGPLADQVELRIPDLEWARVEPDVISLSAGQEKEVEIVFERARVEQGEHEFTLRAHSDKFGKDSEIPLSVEVRDCYSAAITGIAIGRQALDRMPTVCMEEKQLYTFLLENEAAERLDAEISVQGVDAVISPGRVSIESGEAEEISIELDLSGERAGEKEFGFSISSEHFSAQRAQRLIIEDCYALSVDWDSLDEIGLDANCETEAFTVKVLNTGTRSQEVAAGIEGPTWVSLSPQQLVIPAGEERELFVYMSPPYNVREGRHSATVSIGARDVEEIREIGVNVFGGLYAELGEASVAGEASSTRLIEEVESTVETTLLLSNDSNALLRIEGIVAEGFNAEISFQPVTLQPGQTVEVPMSIYLGKGWTQEQFTVPLKIATDKGELQRDLKINLGEEEQAGTGLFVLPDLGESLTLGLAAIVILLIAALTVKYLAPSLKQKPKTGLAELAKEVQEIPGKKLEEIGKGKKQGRKKKQAK